jgi:hypothetical protein
VRGESIEELARGTRRRGRHGGSHVDGWSEMGSRGRVAAAVVGLEEADPGRELCR